MTNAEHVTAPEAEHEIDPNCPFIRASGGLHEDDDPDDTGDRERNGSGSMLWLYDRSESDNVIKLSRPTISNIGSATVVGDLDAPNASTLLSTTACVSTAVNAPRVSGDRWGAKEGLWGDLLHKFLIDHPEQPDKGGNAICFSEGQLARTINRERQLFKVEKKMIRILALTADIDGGCRAEEVIQTIRARGIFAVVYTTHSHTVKGGPGSDRFRIIMPLAEPFELGKREDDPKAWDYRLAQWKAHYFGFLETIIPEGGEIDSRGAMPSQMMYAPARPSGAAYKHYILAGRGLSIDDMPEGDPAKYRKAGPSGGPRQGAASKVTKSPFLSDGFNLLAWHSDYGDVFDLRMFLEMVGWDVRNGAGDWYTIQCPNAAAHTTESDEAYALDGPDAENGAVIHCFHDNCNGVRTCDFLRMLEADACLPDGYDALSHLLCDEMFYPDDMAPAVYDHGVMRPVVKLRTAKDVERAFELVGELDDDAIASLYAGVIWAKNKESAKQKLDELVGGTKKDRDSYRKAGESYLSDWQAKEEITQGTEAAADFVLSLDPSDPLGGTPEQKLETLSARFSISNYKGKVLVFRNVGRIALEAGDDLLEFWTKDALKQFYAHESWPEGEGRDFKWVNPVDRWWGEAKRHTRVVFDPSEPEHTNDINLFDSSRFSLEPAEGDTSPITWFIKNIICDGNEEAYKWLILYLAHMVQRPWERPGTAIVLYGDGRSGKGTFGEIVRRLTYPYNTTLIDPNHVVGTFAGPALATSLAVISEEAVFGKSAEVADRLKGMITLEKQRVEAKGVQSIVVAVYYRMFFDSNHDVPVRIEGNNSEMRFEVLKVSSAKMGDKEYFKELYGHINGLAMQAFLKELEEYDPAVDNLEWDDVRLAPETVHRKRMWAEGLNASDKAFMDMLEDGEFLWKDGSDNFRVVLSEDGENRLPARPLDDFVRSFASRYESDSRPAIAVWKRLFREDLAKPKTARLTVERRVINEGSQHVGTGETAQLDWQPVGLNTSMYHFQGLSTIRAALRDRTGQELDGLAEQATDEAA
ncbi:hypothetical protein SAMN04488020_103210 [Palleronia marisminoris]|uniref:NrS-1 polymerase-like helicase domain-containing protein n=1 Tax=Palleronia marisminoris TaxID=315423 RepID=A0A1Y5S9I0_9RHOB|nr:primase-helicase family protein [Palleronia marisminoris]SFG69364.1 hypothetical protein SAMN04488020_103210 [Palleronia marisminoris]SLN35606.1 hypothetical protein PAM7066_01490 [Palleronia marisminoris]